MPQPSREQVEYFEEKRKKACDLAEQCFEIIRKNPWNIQKVAINHLHDLYVKNLGATEREFPEEYRRF